jgi:hypothetical protein
MDHQAFAQLLGNYGEFVGAIAVVITLAYLARQVHQRARCTRACPHSMARWSRRLGDADGMKPTCICFPRRRTSD